MEKIKIYFEHDSELTEYESINKGYRLDVFVQIQNDIYNVKVYSILRLQEDFISEIEEYGFYAVEPNLIIVKETRKEEIVSTIIKLYEQEYFQEIKTVANIEISQMKNIY